MPQLFCWGSILKSKIFFLAAKVSILNNLLCLVLVIWASGRPSMRLMGSISIETPKIAAVHLQYKTNTNVASHMTKDSEYSHQFQSYIISWTKCLICKYLNNSHFCKPYCCCSCWKDGKIWPSNRSPNFVSPQLHHTSKPRSWQPGTKSGLFRIGVRGAVRLVRPSIVRMDRHALTVLRVMGLVQRSLTDSRLLTKNKFKMGHFDWKDSISSQIKVGSPLSQSAITRRCAASWYSLRFGTSNPPSEPAIWSLAILSLGFLLLQMKELSQPSSTLII